MWNRELALLHRGSCASSARFLAGDAGAEGDLVVGEDVVVGEELDELGWLLVSDL